MSHRFYLVALHRWRRATPTASIHNIIPPPHSAHPQPQLQSTTVQGLITKWVGSGSLLLWQVPVNCVTGAAQWREEPQPRSWLRQKQMTVRLHFAEVECGGGASRGSRGGCYARAAKPQIVERPHKSHRCLVSSAAGGRVGGGSRASVPCHDTVG